MTSTFDSEEHIALLKRARLGDVVGPPNGGWWSVVLDRTNLVGTFTYHDVDMGGVGTYGWVTNSSICTVNNY